MRHELKIPTVGESIQEVQIGQWRKGEGQAAGLDETLVELESDKATVELAAPVAGVLTQILHRQGDVVAIGTVIGYLDDAPQTAAPAAAIAKPQAAPAPSVSIAKPQAAPAAPEPQPAVAEKSAGSQLVQTEGRPAGQVSALHGAAPRSEEIVPMTWIRRRIAERLVEAKNTGALLTTFNEVDMSAVIALRQQYREIFQERYNAKLGFMSFFVKAVIESLKACPELNAEIRENNIVYRNFYDISIAVGGGKGLVVPVIRNAELLSFAEIEQAITDFAGRAKSGQLKPDELTGGTFTITNGGVFGSMLSTPIVNPPQSGILGLHAIQDRPVARDGQVVIRPMMYVALTYDHRIVDGREAVGFVVRIKEYIEEPTRLLLQV